MNSYQQNAAKQLPAWAPEVMGMVWHLSRLLPERYGGVVRRIVEGIMIAFARPQQDGPHYYEVPPEYSEKDVR